MEIQLVREKKAELENSISKLIKDFKDETGVKKLNVRYSEEMLKDARGEILPFSIDLVQVEVKL